MHFLINFAIFVLYLVFSNHISRIQMRYFIHFAYKGTPFHGWQKQNNAITVQEVLDEKLSIIEKEQTWLLTYQNEIVWVVGHRIDNRFKVTGETEKVLKITY